VDIAIANNLVRPIPGISEEERIFTALENSDKIARTGSIYRPSVPLKRGDEEQTIPKPLFISTIHAVVGHFKALQSLVNVVYRIEW
jgi:hypothetical protein